MPSRSTDGFDAAIDEAARRVREAADALAPVGARATSGAPTSVLIDGQSGAGKTTLAARLRELWAGPVEVVALDDVYPGWDGLAAGAEAARAQILVPWSEGRDAAWRRWDWARSAPGDERLTRADASLIIEGSGVLTEASAAYAPIRVWLDSPEAARRERALTRDGDAYRPHWERWAAQERSHLERDNPRSLATLIVDVP